MENDSANKLSNSFRNCRRIINYRPVVACAAAFGAGVFFAEKLGVKGSLVGTALFFILCLLAWKWGMKRTAICMIALILGALRMMFAPIAPAEGEYSITGRVAEMPVMMKSGQTLILDEVTLSGEPMEGKLKLFLEELSSAEYGSIVCMDAEVFLPKDATNQGEMNLKKYYRGQGIVALAYAEKAEASLGNLDFYGWCLTLRTSLKENIAALFPAHTGVVSGLLLGDKGEIPEDDIAAFRDAGVAHLLAISGLHISILAVVVAFLLRRLPPVGKLLVLGGFLLVYSAMTGFSASVVRASVMTITSMLAEVLGRRYDAPSALSAAFLLLLLAEPYYLFQVGFQLSFSAVAGILLLYPVLQVEMKRLFAPLRDSLSLSLAASVGVMPVTMYCFHRMPLFSLLANLLAVPIAPLVLVPALIAAVIFRLLPGIAQILAAPVSFLIDILLSVIRVVSSIPGGVLRTAAPSMLACAAFCAIVFLISPFFLRPLRKRLCYAGAAFILCVCFYCLPQFFRAETEITVLYQNNGGALVVESGEHMLLLDPGAGDYTPVDDWLSFNGISRVDVVFVSDSAQARATVALFEEYEIGQVVLYEETASAKELLQDSGIPCRSFRRGDKMTLGNGLSVTLKDSLWLETGDFTLSLGASKEDASLRIGNGEEGSFHRDGALVLTAGLPEEQDGRIYRLSETGQLAILPKQEGFWIRFDQPK